MACPRCAKSVRRPGPEQFEPLHLNVLALTPGHKGRWKAYHWVASSMMATGKRGKSFSHTKSLNIAANAIESSGRNQFMYDLSHLQVAAEEADGISLDLPHHIAFKDRIATRLQQLLRDLCGLTPRHLSWNSAPLNVFNRLSSPA